MSEQPEQDALQADALEAEELPVPEVPSVGSEEPGSATVALEADKLAEQILAKLAPKLDDLVDARFKSAKDKRLAKVDEIMEFVAKAGGDPKKVLGELTIKDLQDRLAAIETGRVSSAGVQGRTPEDERRVSMEAATAEILTKAGIPFDDSEYKALVAQYKSRISNPVYWSDVVQRFADRRVAKGTKQSAVTSAAAVVSGGGAPAPSMSDDDLVEEISRMQKRPTKDRDRRKKLMDEARQRGLL